MQNREHMVVIAADPLQRMQLQSAAFLRNELVIS